MPQTNNTIGLEKGTVDRSSDEAKGRFIWGVAGGKTGGVDLENRTISGVASTIQVDRDNEIILPKAFKARLGKFTGGTSPFMSNHDHRPATGKPGQIGWVMKIEIKQEIVPCDFRFVDDPQSPAEQWWKLSKDPNGKGIMFSIGFIPIRWVYGSAADLGREFPEIREALAAAGFADDDRLRVYTEIELLEISAVSVGSNWGAIQILTAKMFGKDGEAALDEFEKHIAAKITEQLKGGHDVRILPEGYDVIKAPSDGDSVQSAIRDLQSAIGELQSKFEEMNASTLDTIAEVRELITLSSDPLGMSARQETDAPSADEKTPDADESDGANLQEAAASLRQALK